MKFERSLAIGVIALGAAACGMAVCHAGFVEAVAAYEKGDFDTALRELRPLADDGEVEAQFYMAYMYETGKGVERDDGKAAEYYHLAADQGHDRAQFNLGLAFERGRGVEQDLAQSLEWYLLAANQGFPRAQYKVAEMYFAGSGARRELDAVLPVVQDRRRETV